MPPAIEKKAKVKEGNQIDSTVSISISVVGDLMCHSVQYNYAHIEGDSFDFNPVYKEIKPFLKSSDFTFGNLETVTAGNTRKYSGYPFFNAPDDFVSALKNSGFNLLSTANNHAVDQGEFGILRTIKVLNKNKLGYNGTFINNFDEDSIRIFNIKGIKTAFLAYTYGTNGNSIPAGKDYLVSLINSDSLKHDIKRARKDGADLVIVHYHYGEEYKREPTNSEKEAVNKAVEAGADIIIGGHPHVIQPTKFFKTNNAKLDTGFIAYSLGNFISNQRWRYSDAGVIITMNITKNIFTDSVFIDSVNYIPTWVFKGKTKKGREYIILPSEISEKDSVYSFLTKPDIIKMKQAFNDTKEILTKYSGRIKLKSILPKDSLLQTATH